jgi:hypothetical protein
MSKPIAPAQGIAFAFPDVCKTPAPPGSPVPIPYPNIAQLADASPVADNLVVGPSELKVLVKADSSEISTSTGDEAGSAGGVKSGGIKGACKFVQASASVVYGPNEYGIVRFMDATTQNDENASGFVLGAFPTVLVGD